MSLYDYRLSKQLTLMGASFDALIMAAMRQADTGNAALLQAAFPETWRELTARYNAPGGVLDDEVVSVPLPEPTTTEEN